MQVQDIIPFTIGFLSDEGPIGTGSNGILFPKGQPIPSGKVLTLRRSSVFHLEALYADPSELPAGASPKISCFTVICALHFLFFGWGGRGIWLSKNLSARITFVNPC